MPKKFWFFLTDTPEFTRTKVKEKLVIVDAETKPEAEALARGEGYRSPHAIAAMSREDIEDMIVPESKMDNPLQTISAVRYLESEYERLWDQEDKLALKRIREKISEDFFG